MSLLDVLFGEDGKLTGPVLWCYCTQKGDRIVAFTQNGGAELSDECIVTLDGEVLSKERFVYSNVTGKNAVAVFGLDKHGLIESLVLN